jgi:Outer membrane protein beta-barrel domain
MTSKVLVRSALIVFVLGVFTATLAAQSVELYPYAGGFWPSRVDAWGNNKLKSEGIYGLKGGVFVTPNAELEASFGYLNHFEMRYAPNPTNINPAGAFGQPSVMGFMYDLNAAWNFGQRQFLNHRFSPYIVAGVGGLTTEIRNGNAAFVNGGAPTTDVNGNLIVDTTGARILHDRDTFFTVNYGGGIKAMNIWGPVGFRADIRGRTIPNFFHQTINWPEVTGGLLLSWGER